MRGINLRAVIIANLAVIGVDILSTFVLVILFGGSEFAASRTDEQITAAMRVLAQNTNYLAGALILGTASTVLGGLLAARLARTLPYFNALAFGVVGLLMSVLTVTDAPLWFKVIGFGLTLPAALFGGHLAKRGLGADARK